MTATFLQTGRYYAAIEASSEPMDDGFNVTITLKACSTSGNCMPFLTETVPFVVQTDVSTNNR